jgi:hypothetical protein
MWRLTGRKLFGAVLNAMDCAGCLAHEGRSVLTLADLPNLGNIVPGQANVG